jgi:hypothetical protein
LTDPEGVGKLDLLSEFIHRHSVNTMNLSRSRSSIDSMSAMSHQSSYDNEDLDSLDAISRRTSYDFSDEEIQALNYRHLQNQIRFSYYFISWKWRIMLR